MTDVSGTALEAIAKHVSGLLGSELATVRRIDRGYTLAERWLVTAASGRRAFVKIATEELTRGWLRDEIAVYGQLDTPVMPSLIGAGTEGAHPFIVLEDLGGWHWPPPWSDDHVSAVRESLDHLHALRAPLRRIGDLLPGEFSGWSQVGRDPAPFLSLDLASREWLDRNVAQLEAREAAFDPSGDAVLHMDVRSDNLCLRGGVVKLVDWNYACLGNPRLDLGFWLPSLRLEGGPPPESVMSDSADVAIVVSGYFAARAGKRAGTPALQRIRALQKAQLQQALAWAVRTNPDLT